MQPSAEDTEGERMLCWGHSRGGALVGELIESQGNPEGGPEQEAPSRSSPRVVGKGGGV